MAWNVKAKPALIITLQRTGGSFLAYCLSNHPEIFCIRDEPLSKQNIWYRTVAGSDVKADSGVNVLNLIFTQHDYKVAMCKLINDHAFRPEVWKYITSTKDKGNEEIKIIWLERRNTVAQAISHEINAGRRLGTIKGHPAHTYSPLDVPPVQLDPMQVLKRCINEVGRRNFTRRKVKESKLPCLYLTYRAITGTNDATAIPKPASKQICEFLDVEYVELSCRLRKVHAKPYFETVANWAQVREALLGAGYANDVAEIEAGEFC